LDLGDRPRGAGVGVLRLGDGHNERDGDEHDDGTDEPDET